MQKQTEFDIENDVELKEIATTDNEEYDFDTDIDAGDEVQPTPPAKRTRRKRDELDEDENISWYNPNEQHRYTMTMQEREYFWKLYTEDESYQDSFENFILANGWEVDGHGSGFYYKWQTVTESSTFRQMVAKYMSAETVEN